MTGIQALGSSYLSTHCPSLRFKVWDPSSPKWAGHSGIVLLRKSLKLKALKNSHTNLPTLHHFPLGQTCWQPQKAPFWAPAVELRHGWSLLVSAQIASLPIPLTRPGSYQRQWGVGHQAEGDSFLQDMATLYLTSCHKD